MAASTRSEQRATMSSNTLPKTAGQKKTKTLMRNTPVSNKLVRAGRAMNAAVYFVTQNAADLADESLKNNIGLKFAFRSTDIVEIKKTLEFFGLDPEDEGNQKRLRNLENGQCLMQDLYGHVGVVQFHPVFADFLHGFDTKPPMKAGVAV